MIKKITGLRAGAAGILALFVTACSGAVDEQVMKTYIDYSAAVGGGRGYDAANFVSEATINRYERLRRIALFGEDGGPDLGIYDEVAVYYLRAEFDAAHLQRLTGRDILNILVTADLIVERGFRGFEPGEVQTTDSSTAVLPLEDTETGYSYTLQFIRENGRWVADSGSFRSQRDRRLENRIVEFRGNRQQVISELLIVHGVSDGLSPELLRPLVQR